MNAQTKSNVPADKGKPAKPPRKAWLSRRTAALLYLALALLIASFVAWQVAVFLG